MSVRDWQEPVLRWTATAAFAACAVGFCWSLGEVETSTSFGLFFGALFAGIPGGLFWARELHEATIRRERGQMHPQARLMAQPDVEDAPTAQRSQSSGYYEDDDD